MARKLYGASPADYFANAAGAPVPGATATVWTAATGGTQVTDLQTSAGVAAVLVTADATGGFRFFGPDQYTSELWIDAGGGVRYTTDPTDIPTRLAAEEAVTANLPTTVNDSVAAALPAALTTGLVGYPKMLGTTGNFYGGINFAAADALGATDGDYLLYEGG